MEITCVSPRNAKRPHTQPDGCVCGRIIFSLIEVIL